MRLPLTTATAEIKSPGGWLRTIVRRPANPGDWVFQGLAGLAVLVLLGLLVAMAVYLTDAAWPAITRFGIGFLGGRTWDPVKLVFGALPAIYGTLVTSLIAILFAIPISIGVAIFLADLAPQWLRTPTSFLVEMLAAIPSVVLGLWALFVMVPIVRDPIQKWLGSALGFIPLFQGPPFGLGFLAGGFVLAIMALPLITAIARDSIMAVPTAQKEGMLALGATRWEMIRGAVLPYARSGIVAGSLLGLGRALGETMAVTMVIGNGYQVTSHLFASGNTMASKIATEFNEASGSLYIGSLVELALILFGITLIVNIAGRLLVHFTLAGPGRGGR